MAPDSSNVSMAIDRSRPPCRRTFSICGKNDIALQMPPAVPTTALQLMSIIVNGPLFIESATGAILSNETFTLF